MTAQNADDTPNGDSAAPKLVLVTESDDYSKNVRGIDIKVVRVGDHASPTEIRAATTADWVATSMRIGFSVYSRTVLPANMIAVGAVECAPSGARWCGMDLECGDVVVYGPEAEHVAVNPAGMRFSFAVISIDDLARASDRLDVEIKVTDGSVQRVASSVATQRVRALLPRLPNPALGNERPAALRSPKLINVMSDVLVTAEGDRTASRRLNDSRIVLACIECAERNQRIPTIDELSAASHVSERRLREAFHATQGMAPHAFFVTWGLDLARRRLLAADPASATVAWVACGAGFYHLGRFGRYYKAQYGESPSVTLRRDVPVEMV